MKPYPLQILILTAAIAFLALTACNKKNDDANAPTPGPELNLNGSKLNANNHLALLISYEPLELSQLDEIILISSSCDLSCSAFDGNLHNARKKARSCSNAEAVVISFGTTSGTIKPGTFTTNSGPNDIGFQIAAYQGGKQLESEDASSIELTLAGHNDIKRLASGDVEVSYLANIKSKEGALKPASADQLLQSFTSAGPVKAKACKLQNP